jgi:hypothetical protein
MEQLNPVSRSLVVQSSRAAQPHDLPFLRDISTYFPRCWNEQTNKQVRYCDLA